MAREFRKNIFRAYSNGFIVSTKDEAELKVAQDLD